MINFKFFLVFWFSITLVNCKKDTGRIEVCDTPVPSSNLGYMKRVVYGTSSTRQNLELYMPSGYDINTKVVVLVHGGAWILGPDANNSTTLFSGDLGWDLVQKLLDNNYGVAVMKYRLACYTTSSSVYSGDPMLYMKDMKEDVHLAIQKLKTEAIDSGFSSTEFALIGESAGAHISLMYGLNSSSDQALKTVVSFYSPHSIDDQSFKNTCSTFPFNNLAANSINGFGVERKVSSCAFATTGNVNFFFALKSLADYDLTVSGTNPDSIVDPLRPSFAGNIQRNIPTFIMHGDADGLVPSFHADSIINAITSKFSTTPAALLDFTSPHKMVRYSGCNHGWGGCNTAVIMNNVITWLNNQL